MSQPKWGSEDVFLSREVDQCEFGDLKFGVVQRRPLESTVSSIHHSYECRVGVIEGQAFNEEGGVIHECNHKLVLVFRQVEYVSVVEEVLLPVSAASTTLTSASGTLRFLML